MSIRDGDRLPHRRISTYFNINESICQDGRCFFCARSDPGIFVPFLWDLGGEPYGREQN